MSTIHEALKKAGQELPGDKRGPTLKNGLSLELLRNKKSKVNWGPIFVLLVLALITGPIIAPIFSSPFKHGGYVASQTSAGAPMPMTATPGHVEAQFGIEEMPLPPAVMAPRPLTAIPNFSLSGVVVSSPDSYCLINGKVVKVGEEIDGARLIAVSPSLVTLEYEGKQVQLAVD